MKYRIEKLNLIDIKEVEKLMKDTIDISYKKSYSIDAITFIKYTHSIKFIKKLIKDGHVVKVSIKNNKIIGTGALIGSILTHVYVNPKHHKKGVGKLIVSYLENVALKKNIKNITLEASIPAVKFYEHVGYKKIKKNYMSINKDLIIESTIMKKEINVFNTFSS